MSDVYMDVGQFKEKKAGGWRFVKMGVAKDNGKGGLNLYMDALPISDNQGRCNMSIVPQRERERDATSPGARQITETPEAREPFDSDAPF